MPYYFSVAVRKHQAQGSLGKKVSNWAMVSEGCCSCSQNQSIAAETAERLHLIYKQETDTGDGPLQVQ